MSSVKYDKQKLSNISDNSQNQIKVSVKLFGKKDILALTGMTEGRFIEIQRKRIIKPFKRISKTKLAFSWNEVLLFAIVEYASARGITSPKIYSTIQNLYKNGVAQNVLQWDCVLFQDKLIQFFNTSTQVTDTALEILDVLINDSVKIPTSEGTTESMKLPILIISKLDENLKIRAKKLGILGFPST